MYDCHIIITILPKSLKYNLPPSFMSRDANLSSSFKDFPPLERKWKTIQTKHSVHVQDSVTILFEWHKAFIGWEAIALKQTLIWLATVALILALIGQCNSAHHAIEVSTKHAIMWAAILFFQFWPKTLWRSCTCVLILKKSLNYPKFCYSYHLFLTELSVIQLCHLSDYRPKLDLNSVLLPLSDVLHDNSAKTWPHVLLFRVKNGSWWNFATDRWNKRNNNLLLLWYHKPTIVLVKLLLNTIVLVVKSP